MTTRSSDRSIIRVKDLTEQGPSRFVLLPGGLDRVIIACDYYDIVEGVITAYGPGWTADGPLFSAPIASGYVLLDRRICDVETIEAGLRRMYSDQKDAERLAEELGADEKTKKKGSLSVLRPSEHELEDEDGPFAPPTGPGQYL